MNIDLPARPGAAPGAATASHARGDAAVEACADERLLTAPFIPTGGADRCVRVRIFAVRSGSGAKSTIRA